MESDQMHRWQLRAVSKGRSTSPVRALQGAALALLLVASTSCSAQSGIPVPHDSASASFERPSSAPFLVPLLRSTPAEEASPDLQTLAGWLGEVSVVGLGESIHGVDEFHRLTHRIFAHLAREEDFDVIALEINQAHAARLNDFVHGRRDDLDALMAERWWVAKVFYDEALRDLLLWMREHNAADGRAIHLAGYDFKQPSFAMSAVVATLRRLDPQAAARAESLYAQVARLGGFGVFPNVEGFSGETTIALPPGSESRLLSLGLWIRGSGVSHGEAGVSLGAEGPESGRLHRSQSVPADELGEAWTRVRLEVELPVDADEIRLAIHHRGNGTVWFDGLQVDLDGRTIEREGVFVGMDILDDIKPRPLFMPALQVMDYELRRDRNIAHDGESSMRVDCNPAVDEALEATTTVDALLRKALQASGNRLALSEAVWARQMARLVRQATEWRTLVEPNRDVFLARNVIWLRQQGFPGSRVLACGHTVHTERIPQRMGWLLADEYGDDYKTVSMWALRGEYRYFGDPRSGTTDAPLERYALDPERPGGVLERHLASLAEGEDLLFDRAGASGSKTRPPWLDSLLPKDQGADVVILLREVRPLVLPGEEN